MPAMSALFRPFESLRSLYTLSYLIILIIFVMIRYSSFNAQYIIVDSLEATRVLPRLGVASKGTHQDDRLSPLAFVILGAGRASEALFVDAACGIYAPHGLGDATDPSIRPGRGLLEATQRVFFEATEIQSQGMGVRVRTTLQHLSTY